MDECCRMRAALRRQLQVHRRAARLSFGRTSSIWSAASSRSPKGLKLSPKEYDLLRILVQHAGKVLTHKFLLAELWDNLTDAQFCGSMSGQLRQKIETESGAPAICSHRKPASVTGCARRMRRSDRNPRRDGIKMLSTIRVSGAVMKIPDLLSPSDVMIDVRISDKNGLLRELATRQRRVSNYCGPGSAAPSQREDLGSTGIGRGVAVPHARLPELHRRSACCEVEAAVEFDQSMGKPSTPPWCFCFCARGGRKMAARCAALGPDAPTFGGSG